jgi:DNA processing protein
VTDDERLARLHLSAALEPADPLVSHAVDAVSARDVVDALIDGYPRLDPDGRRGRRLASVDPHRVHEDAVREGLAFVVPGDDQWPPGLSGLADRVRDRRGGSPFGLWVRGHLDAAALGRSVAVVGSRAATPYGTTVATDWCAQLAEVGVATVSGAAYGIDAAAHRGSLAADGYTVAVLACGLDQAYPRGNAALIDRIAEGGAVVSEVASGATVNRGRFLSRNRLIAALASATVVVEAGVRSGALSTARWALDLLRPVGMVPGPVTSASSVGPHQMLREHPTVLVSRPDDVVELVGALGAEAAAPLPGLDRVTDGLGADASLVHESLPARAPVTVAELMAATGLSVSSALRALGELAAVGLVRGEGECWQRARASPRRPPA